MKIYHIIIRQPMAERLECHAFTVHTILTNLREKESISSGTPLPQKGWGRDGVSVPLSGPIKRPKRYINLWFWRFQKDPLRALVRAPGWGVIGGSQTIPRGTPEDPQRTPRLSNAPVLSLNFWRENESISRWTMALGRFGQNSPPMGHINIQIDVHLFYIC